MFILPIHEHQEQEQNSASEKSCGQPMATRIPCRSHCLRHLKLLCCIRPTPGKFCSRKISRAQAHAVSRLGEDINKLALLWQAVLVNNYQYLLISAVTRYQVK